MAGHLGFMSRLVPHSISAWIQFALATPVVLWAGWPFFERGWASLVSRNLNMFTLIAMGVGVAYAYSLIALLAPGVFPPGVRDMSGAAPVYFEAASVITVLVLLGQVLELRKRIELVGDDELERLMPNRQGIVEAKLRDGRELRHHTKVVRGTPQNPMTRPEIDEKCFPLLAPVLGNRRARELIQTVWRLERVSDMRALRPLLGGRLVAARRVDGKGRRRNGAD